MRQLGIIIYFFIIFQLAKNPKVQDKLREEFKTAAGDSNRISYEELMDLPYLDKVIHESLRMNPPLTFSNRVCTETIEIDGVKDHRVTIEKGMRIFIPLLSFHHDPGDDTCIVNKHFVYLMLFMCRVFPRSRGFSARTV